MSTSTRRLLVVALVALAVAAGAFMAWRARRRGSYPRLASCPAEAPPVGAGCAKQGLMCEYERAGWEPGCSALYRCSEGLLWSEYGDPDDESCAIRDAGAGAPCAASYAVVARETPCTTPTTCDYAEGRCACTLACAADRAGGAKTGVWRCDDTEPACPHPRPRIGSACASPGQRCSYEICCAGAELECRDGAWWALLVNIGCEDESTERKD